MYHSHHAPHHMRLSLKLRMAVFLSRLPSKHRLFLTQSRLMVPSPSSDSGVKTPPLSMVLTSTSQWSRSTGRVKDSFHSYRLKEVYLVMSPQEMTTFDISLFSESSMSIIDSMSMTISVNWFNSSRDISASSLIFDPIDSAERGERAYPTSPIFCRSSMAFSISADRKLLGSDTSISSSTSRPDVRAPPYLRISLSIFSISWFSSPELSFSNISLKLRSCLSSQGLFLNCSSSFWMQRVRSVPSWEGGSLSSSISSVSSSTLLCTEFRGSLSMAAASSSSKRGVALLPWAVSVKLGVKGCLARVASNNYLNSFAHSSIFSLRFVVLRLSLSGSSLIPLKVSLPKVLKLAKSRSNSSFL